MAVEVRGGALRPSNDRDLIGLRSVGGASIVADAFLGLHILNEFDQFLDVEGASLKTASEARHGQIIGTVQ